MNEKLENVQMAIRNLRTARDQLRKVEHTRRLTMLPAL